MKPMSRDHQGRLIHIEKGGLSNPSSKLDENKEMSSLNKFLIWLPLREKRSMPTGKSS